MHQIEYHHLSKEDLPRVLQLTNSSVNAEDVYHEYMAELLAHLGESTLGIIATDGVCPVGVALVARGMELTANRTDFFEQIRKDIGEEEIWSGAIVAVAKEYRKQNIGNTLQKKCIAEIIRHGGRHLLLEIWVHPDGHAPAIGSLKLAPAFTDYGEVADFYNIPSLTGHICQICGPICHCKARIVVLHLLPKIEYRCAEPHDYDAVLQLASTYIEPSSLYKSYIKSIHEKLGKQSAGMLALHGQQLVGFCCTQEGMHLTGGSTNYFTEIRQDIGDDSIWSGVLTVVDSEFQRYGIAKKMQELLFEHLRQMEVKYLLIEIWCRPDGYMPARKFMAYGAHSVKEYGIVDDFYRNIPGMESMVCKVCGTPCRCKALIAVIKL